MSTENTTPTNPAPAPPAEAAPSAPAAPTPEVNLDRLFSRPEKPPTPEPKAPPEPPKSTAKPSPVPAKPVPPKKAATTFADDLKREMTFDPEKPAPAKEPTQPPEQPPETPTPPPEQPKDDLSGEKPSVLRQKLVEANKERDQLKIELSRIRLAPKDDPEKIELRKQQEATQKRIQELETELKFASYQRSPEFKEKYQIPLERACKRASEAVAKLPLADESRVGNGRDLMELMQMDDVSAARRARDLFGDVGADVILPHLARIKDIEAAQQDAIEQYRASGQEREKQLEGARAQQKEQITNALREKQQEIESLAPELFAKDEKDVEGNALLESGHQLVDLAFNGHPKARPEQIVQAVTEVRLRAASWGREVKRRIAAEQKVADLEKKLATYEQAEPDGGEPTPKPNTPPQRRTFADDLREAIKAG